MFKIRYKKFYPSIKHEILKNIIRKKVKDINLLKVLDEIIDSTDGVPIGNYLSQFFANLTLAYFDHWIKEELNVRYYFRYADDIVILSSNKEDLHLLIKKIQEYLKYLQLEVKSNYQIFSVDSRGIDFVGYRFFHNFVLLRKNIKKNLYNLLNKYKKGNIDIIELKVRIASYWGWLKYCNSYNLLLYIEREYKLNLKELMYYGSIKQKLSNRKT